MVFLLHANNANIMLCESSNTVNSTESELIYGFLEVTSMLEICFIRNEGNPKMNRMFLKVQIPTIVRNKRLLKAILGQLRSSIATSKT